MTFNRQTLFIIILSLTACFLLAALAMAIYTIRVKNEETFGLLNATLDANEEALSIQSLRTIQYDVAEDTRDFESLVLTGDNLVPLIESIEDVSQALGVDTSIVSVGKVDEKKVVEPYVVRIVIESTGSWSGTLALLKAVENLSHRVTIDESTFSKEAASWRLKMVLLLYSFD